MRNIILLIICIVSFFNIGLCQKENFHEGYEDEIYTIVEFMPEFGHIPNGTFGLFGHIPNGTFGLFFKVFN